MSCVCMCHALGVMCSCDRHRLACHTSIFVHTCHTCQDMHIATAGGNLLPTHLSTYIDQSIIMLIDDSLHKLDWIFYFNLCDHDGHCDLTIRLIMCWWRVGRPCVLIAFWTCHCPSYSVTTLIHSNMSSDVVFTTISARRHHSHVVVAVGNPRSQGTQHEANLIGQACPHTPICTFIG